MSFLEWTGAVAWGLLALVPIAFLFLILSAYARAALGYVRIRRIQARLGVATTPTTWRKIARFINWQAWEMRDYRISNRSGERDIYVPWTPFGKLKRERIFFGG